MSPVDGDGLAVRQYADVVPVDLVVAERRPAVHPRLLDELLEGPASRRGKQLVARVRVVKRNLARRLGLLLQEGRLLPVAREFRIMSVKIADAVRGLHVAVPPRSFWTGVADVP